MPKKTKNIQYYEGIGRRKTSVAIVRLYIPVKKNMTVGDKTIKEGEMLVNGNSINVYFPHIYQKIQYMKPFALAKAEERFCVSIRVTGGGQQSQLEAVVHGIARALEKTDKETMRPLLKKELLLTRDSRARQRRKVGTGGKARRAKQSPKR